MSVPRRPRSLPLAGILVLILLSPLAVSAQQGDPGSITLMLESNDALRAQGMDYIVQQIDYYSQDGSRTSARMFQQEFRWVPGDARRGSSDASLSYLFDESAGDAAPAGLELEDVEEAVERAATIWSQDSCLAKVPLVERGEPTSEVADLGEPMGDVTIFDYVAGDGGLGDPFAADLVAAGFHPGLDNVFSPNILAFSVSFVFVGPDGNPTDVDHDGHLDTAHNEIYFNEDMDWSVHGGSGFDVETATLHEIGHALGLGHFGPPPKSVMNPVYSGIKRHLYPIDHAALCLLYGRR
jgi:hypothetical protein